MKKEKNELTIKKLQEESHKISVEKGFWGKDGSLFRNDAEIIMLVVTELAEAVEGMRRDDWTNVAEELADAMIRIGDYAEAKGIDLSKEIREKMKKNKERPYLHNKKF